MSAKLTKIAYQVSRMFDLTSLYLFFIFHKIIFQIKIRLLIARRRDFPFFLLIQIWKISISLICMVNLCHMSRIAVWKHLTVDLLSADHIDILTVIFFQLFQHFLDSDAYQARFSLPPVICISVSTSKSYRRTANVHPVLGIEYEQPEPSLTDAYFGRMGLQVRYFMPRDSVAPLAFYFRGDLLNDYSNLQLIGTISTMETFQKIYRPEIYNANSAAEAVYSPTLDQQNFSRTEVDYDRVERSESARKQGAFTDEHFITPHGDLLEAWAAERPIPVA